MQTTTEIKNKTSVTDLQEGHFLSEKQYYIVDGKDWRSVHVINENGNPISVSHGIVENDMFTANQHHMEVKVNRDQMIKIFQHLSDDVITVNFNKASKKTEVNSSIKNAFSAIVEAIDTNLTEEELHSIKKEHTSKIKQAIAGEERTMIGYKYTPLWNTEEDLEEFLKVGKSDGRFTVIDLEQRPKLIPIYKRILQVIDNGKTVKDLVTFEDEENGIVEYSESDEVISSLKSYEKKIAKDKKANISYDSDESSAKKHVKNLQARIKSNVVDGYDWRARQVDVRTINWLIWRNVKFVYATGRS